MKAFDALVQIADQLLGPEGCPWDLTQTLKSLQPYVLEEAHEVVEAVDLDDQHKIAEELGDLLYLVIFYSKLGEKQGRFSLCDVLECIKEKMIRRHPHIFGDVRVKDAAEVKHNWEKIKAQEKGKTPGLPPTLNAILRAQKWIRKMPHPFPLEEPLSEEEIGEQLFHLIARAEQSHIDAESALRRCLLHKEQT